MQKLSLTACCRAVASWPALCRLWQAKLALQPFLEDTQSRSLPFGE